MVTAANRQDARNNNPRNRAGASTQPDAGASVGGLGLTLPLAVENTETDTTTTTQPTQPDAGAGENKGGAGEQSGTTDAGAGAGAGENAGAGAGGEQSGENKGESAPIVPTDTALYSHALTIPRYVSHRGDWVRNNPARLVVGVVGGAVIVARSSVPVESDKRDAGDTTPALPTDNTAPASMVQPDGMRALTIDPSAYTTPDALAGLIRALFAGAGYAVTTPEQMAAKTGARALADMRAINHTHNRGLIDALSSWINPDAAAFRMIYTTPNPAQGGDSNIVALCKKAAIAGVTVSDRLRAVYAGAVKSGNDLEALAECATALPGLLPPTIATTQPAPASVGAGVAPASTTTTQTAPASV